MGRLRRRLMIVSVRAPRQVLSSEMATDLSLDVTCRFRRSLTTITSRHLRSKLLYFKVVLTSHRSMPIIENDHIRAEIATRGAELIRLQDSRGTDFLWNGDPAWWTGRAPILFPIVGKVPNDTIVVDGREYPMRQHGFARASEFTVFRADETECGLRLEASSKTRAHYPFNFLLDVRHALGGLRC
jgi:D-hexose-6-phosphate mutarotase